MEEKKRIEEDGARRAQDEASRPWKNYVGVQREKRNRQAKKSSQRKPKAKAITAGRSRGKNRGLRLLSRITFSPNDKVKWGGRGGTGCHHAARKTM